MHRWLSNTFTAIGLVLVVVGWGPLLSVILLDTLGLWPDPDPNPIGLGLLFFVTFWPALIFLLIGAVRSRGHKADDASLPEASPGSNAGKSVNDTTSDQTILVAAEVDNAAPADPTPRLSVEQEIYLDQPSWGSLLGWGYFVLMGRPGAFFSHMPQNMFYTTYIKGGRRQIWESGHWPDFAQFERRSQMADTVGLYAVIAVGVLAVLMLGLVWLVKG